MSRHIADKRDAGKDGRLKHFTEIEREQGGAREQTLDLQKRPRDGREEGRRVQEFVRIERGGES